MCLVEQHPFAFTLCSSVQMNVVRDTCVQIHIDTGYLIRVDGLIKNIFVFIQLAIPRGLLVLNDFFFFWSVSL